MAAELPLLQQYNVTHVLNVASMVENFYPDKFVYKNLDIYDLPSTDITQYFEEAFRFIDAGRADDGCVFVHCNAGVSRAASLVIGYVMKTEGVDYDKAFHYVKQQRPAICPNYGFRQQLQKYKP